MIEDVGDVEWFGVLFVFGVCFFVMMWCDLVDFELWIFGGGVVVVCVVVLLMVDVEVWKLLIVFFVDFCGVVFGDWGGGIDDEVFGWIVVVGGGFFLDIVMFVGIVWEYLCWFFDDFVFCFEYELCDVWICLVFEVVIWFLFLLDVEVFVDVVLFDCDLDEVVFWVVVGLYVEEVLGRLEVWYLLEWYVGCVMMYDMVFVFVVEWFCVLCLLLMWWCFV